MTEYTNPTKGPLAEAAGTAVLWRASQLGVAKALAIGRLLILAWLLIPEDFGFFAIGVAVTAMVLAITDLGLVPALVQHQDAEESHYDAAWTLRLFRASTVAVLVFVTAPLIASMYAESRSTWIIRVVALRPLLESLASIKVAALTRRLRFRETALIDLAGKLAETAVAIGLALLVGAWALPLGMLAGAAASSLFSYVWAPHRPRICLNLASLRPLVGYGRWVFLSGVATAAAGYMLQIVISRQLGVASLGLYYLVMKLAFLPSELSSQVVGSVAFPVYAKLQSDETRTARMFRAVLCATTAVVFPVYALLLVLAPTLENHFLGSNWSGASPLLRIFCATGCIGLLGDAVEPVLYGRGRPRAVTILHTIQAIIAVGCAALFAGLYGLPGVALAVLLASLASQFVAAFYVRGMLERPFTGVVRRTLAVVLASTTAAVIAAVVDHQLPGVPGGLLAAFSGFALAAALLCYFDSLWKLELREDLTRAFPQIANLLRISSTKL